MASSKVNVVVRARPAANFDKNVYKFDESNSCIDVQPPQHGDSSGNEQWHFKIDKLLVNSTQDTVFSTCAENVIASVMEGYNGTIMAYGQTGAGKTFTISGGAQGGNSYAQRGIIPRSISRIYNEVANRPENIITVRLSYIEIYNELIFDLLAKTTVGEQKGDLVIYDGPKGAIFCKGLTMMKAGTEEQALNIYFRGDAEKAVAEHALNNASSRSHTLFSIYIDSKSRVESSERIVSSKLHLVDLAGSERLKKTNSEGLVMKEASYINKSLSYLEQVVLALGDKSRDHVPYRQSKLTHFLKDSLGGNCKTTMIANVFPEPRFLEETGSTLRFATRMMKVVNKPGVNIQLDNNLLLKKYERDISDLKQELSMHDTLAGRGRIQYGDYTPDEQKVLEAKVRGYVQGETEHLEIPSIRMVHEAFSIFRKLMHGLQKELRDRPKMGETRQTGPAAGAGAEATGPIAGAAEGLAAQEGQVGQDEEGAGGFSVGMAAADSRPHVDPDAEAPAGDEDEEGKAVSSTQIGAVTGVPAYTKTQDKQSLFTEWKQRAGQQYEEKFQACRTELLKKKTRSRELVNESKEIKHRIEMLKEQLAKKRMEQGIAGADEEVIDEEEYALLAAQQSEKAQYMTLLEEKKALDGDILNVEHDIQSCKKQLMQAFEAWHSRKYGREEDAAAQAMIAAGTDLKEQYDKLEAAEYGEAYSFHKAQKMATLQKSRKRG